MKIAIFSLSPQGARIAEALAEKLDGADIYLHSALKDWTLASHPPSGRGVSALEPVGSSVSFDSIVTLTASIFDKYEGLIFIAPCGAVVRAIAPCIKNKLTDPAVVVIDAGGRYAISLLSGHEGGANLLAVEVANILDAEPVITTTTEAVKKYIVGIGCRKGVPSEIIIEAVTRALDGIGLSIGEVRCLATADVKAREPGFLEAARLLGIPLRIISSEEIRSSTREFGHSDFVKKSVNLPAVSEPSALLAGRRTSLVLSKTAHRGVTVAVAVESSLSLG